MLQGCTMPCNIYFRNLFQATVGLNVQLTSRDYFTKLPNKNSILRITKKGKNICGDWKQNQLITWVDSVNFYIDVPTNTVVNLKDISNGLTRQ